MENSKQIWFLLAGNEPEGLIKIFDEFYTFRNAPNGLALWKWKKTCWICSPEAYREELNSIFHKYNIVEFSSAPSPTDIEFMCGDNFSIKNNSK